MLVLDKPPGMSSATAADYVKKRLGAKRAGHGGTLDPIATGVLPICLGEARKLAAYLLADDKEYEADVLLGVEVPAGSLAEGAPAREYGGRTFEVWTPVHTFAGASRDAKVYLLDRSTGTVTFAPALDLRNAEAPSGELVTLAAVPPAHREIRLWYRTGGGPAGNVAADTLTAQRDPIAGVRVSNAFPARGGRVMETTESALARGPYEFFAQRRAITARDFELLATSASAAVARAKAFTRTTMWSFARPGEVEVVLVPYVGAEARPDWRLPVATLVDHQMDAVRRATQLDLDGRRALGTGVVATWARYKAVSVRGRVVVGPHEDVDAVRRRIQDRLHQTVSPLPTDRAPVGWTFGEPLRASNVYRLLEQAEPGVRYVNDVRFVVDEAPDGRVRSVAADQFQPHTWYAGSADAVFRSTNGGQGWEPVGRFPEEEIRRVVPAQAASRPGVTRRPGLVAAITRTTEGGSGVHVSTDLGESWRKVAELEAAVADAAWIDRDEAAALLLATDVGLYELSLEDGAVPLQIRVDDKDLDRAFYAVRAFVSERGVVGVAVAAQAKFGVYLSLAGGRPGTFTHVGLSGVDTRTLAVQIDGPNTVLWAGVGESDATRPGQGCHRARLFEADVRWSALSAGWSGGTCWGLDFAGSTVLAATQSAGVVRMDADATNPTWQPPNVNCGLPLRDRTRFEPVETVAAVTAGGLSVLAGGPRGVQLSTDAQGWRAAANRETRDVVTIPETWLLCSGEHDIEVVREDATPGH